MSNINRVGVFLCECGQKIAPLVDLSGLVKKLKGNDQVDYAAIMPFPCLTPGMEDLKETIKKEKLDRLVVAGCEARILLKKFERELLDLGIEEGQIDMVNLRDHVAQVHDISPEEAAEKGYKLIMASVAGLKALEVKPKELVDWNGPVMILGGGVATYSAAQELIRKGIDCILAVATDEWEDEIRMLHEHYPGERHYYQRLEKMLKEVDESPHSRTIVVGQLVGLTGRTGDFQVTFTNPLGDLPIVHQAGAVIACLDGQMLNQGTDFGHDGVDVVCHTEMEELFWTLGVPQNDVVFWINDYEAKQEEFAYLSARAAWSMARYIREGSAGSKITMLYNQKMPVPLSAGERTLSRELDINWLPYDPGLRPTVQSGFITYCDPESHTEEELAWGKLVLSPRRSVGVEVTKVANVLGLEVRPGQFLEKDRTKVRPEMQGREETYLAGSARYPCDLHEALRQGRRAAAATSELVEKGQAGELYAPRMVCVVDESKCIGCGLCREICDCGGIEPVEGLGGNIPRHVDPLVCTGGATCAAACPYHALTLQNNSLIQRESRVKSLAHSLNDGEFLSYGCYWGGFAAADNAGVKALKYDPRMYMLRVSCIGQLDPSVMARALLEGSPGLLLLGCPPEACHHSFGVDHTWSRVNLIKKLLYLCGFDRRRIVLAHADLNEPEEYIRTVESYLKVLDEIGPIERTPENLTKLQGIYDTVNSPRVRWVVGASLRRPWEDVYPGNQRNALAFDKDLMGILSEEFIKARLTKVMSTEQKAFEFGELKEAIQEDNDLVMSSLKEMVAEGLVGRMHKDGVAQYIMK